MTVLLASSAVEALRILHRPGPSVRAIVTDLNMPRMDGFELIRRIRDDRALASTPIIVVSADTDPATPGANRPTGRQRVFPQAVFAGAGDDANWSRFSMVRINRLFAPALLLWPLWLSAQTQPDLAAILDRLDRLERENRALTAEVRSLRARLDSTGDAKPAPAVDAEAVPDADGQTPAPASANRRRVATPGSRPPSKQKLDIQGKRIDEQAQTKVEASQKFPIRLTGMALFNAFMNSKQNGGFEYPAVASAPTDGGHRRDPAADHRRAWISAARRRFGAATFTARSIWIFRPAPRIPPCVLRTGSIELDWKDRNIMVGVEKPIFNPREPSSLAQWPFHR